MAQTKLDAGRDLTQNEIRQTTKVLSGPLEVRPPKLPPPSHKDQIDTELRKLLKQRRWQRFAILTFSIALTIASFLFLVSGNIVFHTLKGTELDVVAVSVFGQIIAVIAIITKSLWDDKNYMELFRQ